MTWTPTQADPLSHLVRAADAGDMMKSMQVLVYKAEDGVMEARMQKTLFDNTHGLDPIVCFAPSCAVPITVSMGMDARLSSSEHPKSALTC